MLRVESCQFSTSALALNLPNPHLTPPLQVTHLSFAEIFGIRKLESLGYCVALFA